MQQVLKNAGTLAAAIAMATSPVSAQTMWQGAEFGMSQAKVQSVQPAAVSNPEPSTLYGGAKCLLHIPGYQLEGSRYEVCYYFLSSKRTQVTLGFEGKPTKRDFDNIVTMLTAKYGKPVSVAEDSIGWDADWKLENGVKISVIFIGKKPLSPLININFQYKIAQESSKL